MTTDIGSVIILGTAIYMATKFYLRDQVDRALFWVVYGYVLNEVVWIAWWMMHPTPPKV
jgi:hypothetical protein